MYVDCSNFIVSILLDALSLSLSVFSYLFLSLSIHTHTHTHVYIYIYIYHHHHVVPLARISLIPSRHFSLSFIPAGWSSGLHPLSSHSCCMYVLAGRPAFARPYAGVHRSSSLMSSFLLLQQCPASLVRLTCIVFVIGGRWPYSWCFVGCCRQDLFNIALNILVWLPSSFFSCHFVRIQVVHPYSSIDTTSAWKKLRFILSVWSERYIYIYIYIYMRERERKRRESVRRVIAILVMFQLTRSIVIGEWFF